MDVGILLGIILGTTLGTMLGTIEGLDEGTDDDGTDDEGTDDDGTDDGTDDDGTDDDGTDDDGTDVGIAVPPTVADTVSKIPYVSPAMFRLVVPSSDDTSSVSSYCAIAEDASVGAVSLPYDLEASLQMYIWPSVVSTSTFALTYFCLLTRVVVLPGSISS